MEKLELNKIYNMDCVKGMKRIPNSSIDLVVTDPPYGINWKAVGNGQGLTTKDGILNDGADNVEMLEAAAIEIYRVLRNDSHIYWFTRWDKVDIHKPMLERIGFKVKNNLIWVKNSWGVGDLLGAYAPQYECILFCHKGRRLLNEVDGRKRHTDIQEYPRVAGKKQIHHHQKPQDLLEFLIKKSSEKGDVILDPFMGSGSTAIAAKIVKRKFIGFELDEHHCTVAVSRVKDIKEE